MLQGLSIIAEQWFVVALVVAMIIFLVRRDFFSVKITTALLLPLTLGLLLREFLWNHPLFWNFGYGMLSIFTLWYFLFLQLTIPRINARLWCIGFFLFIGVVLNYARHIDRINNTYYVRPIYFVCINASNIGVLLWVYMPLIKGLIKFLKGKVRVGFNFSYFQR